MAALLLLPGCGAGGIDQSTPLSVAQAFTQAEINGDSKVLKQIDASDQMDYSINNILELATNAHFSQYKLGDFQFKQTDDHTVKVTLPEAMSKENMGQRRYNLYFLEKDGKYFFSSLGPIALSDVSSAKEDTPKFSKTDADVLNDLKQSHIAIPLLNSPSFTSSYIFYGEPSSLQTGVTVDKVNEFKIIKSTFDVPRADSIYQKLTIETDFDFKVKDGDYDQVGNYNAKGTFELQYSFDTVSQKWGNEPVISPIGVKLNLTKK